MFCRAAETIGCRVHGITLSKEQMALAEEKVRSRRLYLVTNNVFRTTTIH